MTGSHGIQIQVIGIGRITHFRSLSARVRRCPTVYDG
jgi:hypothetical protein